MLALCATLFICHHHHHHHHHHYHYHYYYFKKEEERNKSVAFDLKIMFWVVLFLFL